MSRERERFLDLQPIEASGTIGQTLRRYICKDCPLRRASSAIKTDSLDLFSLITEDGTATVEDLEYWADLEKEENRADNLAKCARTMLRGACDMYGENPQLGHYIVQKVV